MLPQIIRPSGTVEVITDLAALQEVKTLQKQIEELQKNTANTLTELEASQQATRVSKLKKKIIALSEEIDESTIVFTLHGVTGGVWEQLVAQNTKIVDGRQRQDPVQLVVDSMRVMVDKAVLKTKPDEPVECSQDEVAVLVKEMPDSQVMALLPEIQRLNTPSIRFPKVSNS